MVIPLLATLISSGIMVLVLDAARRGDHRPGRPGPTGSAGTSAVLLGIMLGLMMVLDMGGPVNKAAYAFATAGLALHPPERNTGPW